MCTLTRCSHPSSARQLFCAHTHTSVLADGNMAFACGTCDACVANACVACLPSQTSCTQTQVMIATESFSDVTSAQESVEDSCHALLVDLHETGCRIQRTVSKIEDYQAQAEEELADIMSTALQR